MRIRHIAAMLAGAITVTMMAAPVSAAPVSGAALLAAYGIDSSKLAPGWKVGGSRVVWQADGVAMVLGAHGKAACEPTFSVCLYETDNYNDGPYDHNKRMLEFDDVGWRNLASYGFDNQMSSWYNPLGLDARWFYNSNIRGTSRCMSGRAGAMPKLGADNDQASSLLIYSDVSHCAKP